MCLASIKTAEPFAQHMKASYDPVHFSAGGDFNGTAEVKRVTMCRKAV